jgi:hypothetical protein
MPFPPTPIPAKATRNVVIQLKGPKDKKQLARLNKELKKVARKHGARFKKRTTKKRR